MAPNKITASFTVFPNGPPPSWDFEIGMIPARLTRPTVGFIPTNAHIEAGHAIDPSVSVPTATTHRSAATATADPELEPHGDRSRIYGFLVWPPLLLHPLDARVERKFAHSLRFVFPRITAPASLNFFTTKASLEAIFPSRASDPAVVCILSLVLILSFNRTGIPCNGPLIFLFALSLSNESAMARASGLTSMTEFNDGPVLSIC